LIFFFIAYTPIFFYFFIFFLQKKEENIEGKDEIIQETIMEEPEPQIHQEDQKLGPDSFIIISQLGKGSFGDVYLVEKKNTRERYALKVLKKNKIFSIQNIYIFYDKNF
jgi:serine/threonine protein kinase